jgi:hypothetical protein
MARKISIKLICKSKPQGTGAPCAAPVGFKKEFFVAGACPDGISGRCFSMIDIEHPEVI